MEGDVAHLLDRHRIEKECRLSANPQLRDGLSGVAKILDESLFPHLLGRDAEMFLENQPVQDGDIEFPLPWLQVAEQGVGDALTKPPEHRATRSDHDESNALARVRS